MIDIEKAQPYLRAHRGALFVVKVGGECLSTPLRLRRLAAEIALVESLGPRLVVVHGAGPQTDALVAAAGEAPVKVGGRRVTTPIGLRALRQATLGELNGDLAAALSAAGAPAVGLAAASAGIVVAERRPPVVVGGETIDFGEVGDVRATSPAPLVALLDAGLVPVVAPPASDGARGFLNVNADLVAAHLALSLRAAKLLLLTSTDGVLTDPRDPHSLLSTLTLQRLGELERTGAVADGMKVKAEAARLALEGGVGHVHVVSGTKPGALVGELYTPQGTGTLVTLEEGAAPSSVQPRAEALA